jgi:hypothetical protein
MAADHNGFASEAAMTAAHAVLLKTAGVVAGDVLDLGCGDGTLLRRLKDGGCGVRTHGVEVDLERARHATANLDVLHVCNLTDVERWKKGKLHYTLICFMPGRLLELPPETRHLVRTALRSKTSQLLAYNYDGLDLRALVTRAGLCWDRVLGCHEQHPTSAALLERF